MRLFIAIPFSEEFKGELIRVQNEMRANGVRGNFSRAENLHVTVAFLGEVEDPMPAMKALGVGKNAIVNGVKDGTLQVFRHPSGNLFSKAALNAWIMRRTSKLKK